jgi:hypothetical protein
MRILARRRWRYSQTWEKGHEVLSWSVRRLHAPILIVKPTLRYQDEASWLCDSP